MTVGQHIQKHRKDLNMSQEELGQKLLVSRQTISLWEKDQTIPTLDNLMRLRDVFGISIDEILGYESNTTGKKLPPLESYQFQYTKEELTDIYRTQRNTIFKKPIITITIVYIILIVVLVSTSAPDFMVHFIVSLLILTTIGNIKNIRTFNTTWKNNRERMCCSVYEYNVFGDHIVITIYHRDEKVRESKCYFTDIEQLQVIDRWLFLQYGGQVFILRKNELKENSALLEYISATPSKSKKSDLPARYRLTSTILYIASLCSLPCALALIGVVSEINKAFVENLWLFLLFIPVSVASVIFGIFLKAKGYKRKRNIVVGIIMTIIFGIYGSFTFLFADVYDHSDTPIVRTEQLIGIDIPTHTHINTQDWTQGTQSVSRGYIYYNSDIYFDDNAVDEFEKTIKNDVQWLSSIPNDLIGIASPLIDHTAYDHALIYNIDTHELNVLPKTSGTFRFITILYQTSDNQMTLTEYAIDYEKSNT